MEKSLINEILELLKTRNRSQKDILWVSKNNYYESWDDFVKQDFKYDYESMELIVSYDIVIMGEGWFITRDLDSEYCTWSWEYCLIPKKPKDYKIFNARVSKEEIERWNS